MQQIILKLRFIAAEIILFVCSKSFLQNIGAFEAADMLKAYEDKRLASSGIGTHDFEAITAALNSSNMLFSLWPS